MGCHFLLQGIFPTQGSNSGLPHCGQTLYHLSHQGIPNKFINILLKEEDEETAVGILNTAITGNTSSPGVEERQRAGQAHP